MIVFEHPFNERIRTYLRLESLYARLQEMLKRQTVYDHHFALVTLFEILEIAGRPDLKTEVLKDIDKQKNLMLSYKGNPAINEVTLDGIVAELDASFSDLSQSAGRIGLALTESDWLMAVRSRVSIPGGTCSFDLPSYFAWQGLACVDRQRDLQAWSEVVFPLHKAVLLLLRLIRVSEAAQMVVATGGLFQQTLPGKSFSLVRVSLPSGVDFVPEITVNRLLVSVRFVHAGVHERARPVTHDVGFELLLN